METEKWKVGKNNGVVVSNVDSETTNFNRSADDRKKEIEYYGGYLVCESIGSLNHANLISTAIEMKLALKQVVGAIEGATKNEDGSYNQRFGQAFIDYLNEILKRSE